MYSCFHKFVARPSNRLEGVWVDGLCRVCEASWATNLDLNCHLLILASHTLRLFTDVRSNKLICQSTRFMKHLARQALGFGAGKSRSENKNKSEKKSKSKNKNSSGGGGSSDLRKQTRSG